MANLDVKLNFFKHPKTRRLVGLLGKGAELLPLKIWAHCGEVHPETGQMTGYAAQEIESIAEWWGKSGAAVEALEKVRFLVPLDGGGWACHQWEEHAGHIVAFAERAKKGAKVRWDKIRNAPSNASSITTSNAPSVRTNVQPPIAPQGGDVRAREKPREAGSRTAGAAALSAREREALVAAGLDPGEGGGDGGH